MRSRISALVIVYLTFGMAGSTYAEMAELEGKWKNVDPNTRGLSTVEVTVDGGKVKVHVWGKCHPTDCDWGTVEATAYAPSVSGVPPGDAQALSAVFATTFNQSLVIISPAGEKMLRVEVLTYFTDKSGRSAYCGVYKFSR